MKKVERYIYITLIVILVGIISAGTTYIIMKNNDKTEIKENNNNSNNNEQDKNENQNNNEEPNKPEKIVLSNKELEEYIKYIPDYITLTNEELNQESIYKRKNTNINELKNTDLLAKILYVLTIEQDLEIETGNNIVSNTSKLNTIMQEKYNQKLDNYHNSFDENGNFRSYVAKYDYLCFSKKDNNFSADICTSGNGSEFNSIIDNYDANDTDLIIYTYNGLEYDDGNKIIIEDIYTRKQYEITNSSSKEYIKNNKSKFTKYKHIFKKNSTGYYWYSTEIVN